MPAFRERILGICGVCALLFSGCVSGPYQYGQGWRQPVSDVGDPADTVPEISEGRPNKFIDGVGWVIGIPGKLLLWDRRVDNHCVSDETVDAVAGYIEDNQLQDVCVRVNEYAPGEEWRRLCDNKNVGAGWRYTLGTVSLVGYTLLPGRLLGGDRYNPYTNSVYLYSDIPALGIQSAAYAKDVQGREFPGSYAAFNELPIVSIWHETINTRDALGYAQVCCDHQQQVEAVRILHPYYGMRVGGAVGNIVGPSSFMVVGGAVAGHVSGWVNTPADPDEATVGVATLSAAARRSSGPAAIETHSSTPVARGQQSEHPTR